MSELEDILEETRPRLEQAIAGAEAELAGLEIRRNELRDLIARGKSALGEEEQKSGPHETMTLHKAIEFLLKESGNEWTHVKDLAKSVNERQLYAKRDGSEIQSNQIHARTKNYAEMFEKDGPLVRLSQTD